MVSLYQGVVIIFKNVRGLIQCGLFSLYHYYSNSDDGQYECMAENNGAPGNVFTVYSDPVTISIECKLIVVMVISYYGYLIFFPDPPLVMVDPVSLIVNQTALATFTCTIFGIPTPTFIWTRDSGPTPLVSNPGILEITNVTNGNNITTMLTIISTKRTDMDQYICSATNGIENLIKSPESDSVELFIQGNRYYV